MLYYTTQLLLVVCILMCIAVCTLVQRWLVSGCENNATVNMVTLMGLLIFRLSKARLCIQRPYASGACAVYMEVWDILACIRQ